MEVFFEKVVVIQVVWVWILPTDIMPPVVNLTRWAFHPVGVLVNHICSSPVSATDSVP